MRRLLIFLSTLMVVNSSCPSGFELVADGQCRGKQATVETDWGSAVSTAITRCREIQGQVLIIHNAEENAYWAAIAGPIYATTQHFVPLGLVCNSNSMRWEWADGSPIDYVPVPGLLDSPCYAGDGRYITNDGFWGTGTGPGYVLDIFCTTQLQQPPRSDNMCENFADDDRTTICFQIGGTAANWQDAQKMCRNFGADLASIHNSKENEFVRQLAIKKGKIDSVFIGATYYGRNGFDWIDGSQWDYDNFYPGFPNKALGDCVAMDIDGTSGLWANVNCSSKLSFACIRQQPYNGSSTCAAGPWREGDIIYSPGFPFDASTPCDFLLTVDSGKRVEVEILLLEANSCCDHLLIFENYMGGTVIANLTGELNDKTYKTSSSNFMRVSWKPNGGVNVRGMMMTYRAV